MTKFAVGQVIHLSYSGSTGAAQACIATVGRRWISLDNGDRFDPQTMELEEARDPGLIIGTAYLTAAERNEHVAKGRLWSALRVYAINNSDVPPALALADLVAAVSILQIVPGQSV